VHVACHGILPIRVADGAESSGQNVPNAADLLDVPEALRCANVCKSMMRIGGPEVTFTQIIDICLARRYTHYAREQSNEDRQRQEFEGREARPLWWRLWKIPSPVFGVSVGTHAKSSRGRFQGGSTGG
jgi:hypothetical protein